jgi:transcriptional regulator with XRE-family HTH domain
VLAEPGAVNDVIVIVKGGWLRANILVMTFCVFRILGSFDEMNMALHTRPMARWQKITAAEEAAIAKRLRRTSNATFVAGKTGFSYSTVWRVAEAAGIELIDGKRAKGYKRLSPEKRAAVIEARHRNPDAPQREIAAQAGVSRSTVWRIERAHRGDAVPSMG